MKAFCGFVLFPETQSRERGSREVVNKSQAERIPELCREKEMTLPHPAGGQQKAAKGKADTGSAAVLPSPGFAVQEQSERASGSFE